MFEVVSVAFGDLVRKMARMEENGFVAFVVGLNGFYLLVPF